MAVLRLIVSLFDRLMDQIKHPQIYIHSLELCMGLGDKQVTATGFLDFGCMSVFSLSAHTFMVPRG